MRGDRLRWAREKQGLSQRDLAARCDLGEKQIWRYENGASEPTAGILTRIAKELIVSVDFLLDLTDEPTGNIEESDLSDMERRLIAALRQGRIQPALETFSEIVKSKESETE